MGHYFELLFQGLVTALLVFGLTVLWDRRRASVNMRNLTSALFWEMYSNYRQVIMNNENLSSSIAFKSSVWERFMPYLAGEMGESKFGMIHLAYEVLDGFPQTDDPLLTEEIIWAALKEIGGNIPRSTIDRDRILESAKEKSSDKISEDTDGKNPKEVVK